MEKLGNMLIIWLGGLAVPVWLIMKVDPVALTGCCVFYASIKYFFMLIRMTEEELQPKEKE